MPLGRQDSEPATVRIADIPIHRMRMSDVLRMCEDAVRTRAALLIGVVNVAKVVNALKDAALRDSILEADIVVAAGMALVWLSRLLGRPLPERVAGIDIMFRLLERADAQGYSVFFLGATAKVAARVAEVAGTQYPGARIAGFHHGYFQHEHERDIATRIRESRADILFIGMSSPKKEVFMRQWRDFMGVPVCHGVGGSFDVMAGVTGRAPLWMQKAGLEWLYRVLQEPRRMWKRYLVTNIAFAGLVIRECFDRRRRAHIPSIR